MKQPWLWLSTLLFAAQLSHAQSSVGSDPRTIASELLERLDHAWTAGDGAAFASEFSEDADIINIFGGHFHGRAAIAERMQAIFDTIFKGSVHRSRTLESVRELSADILVAVSSARVDVPSGPQAPQIVNRQTVVLLREHGEWKIIHWHNTPIRDQ